MYISRSEAAKRLKVSDTRLRQLEKQGKLVRVAANGVNFRGKSGVRGGRETKWVYEEAQVAALVGKTGADARFARAHRTDAMVFDMLAGGANIIEIVRRLRLDLSQVERLRDIYVKEAGGFVVTARDVQAARELGFDLTAKTFTTILTRLLEHMRGAKLTRDKLARLKVVPDE